MFALTKSRFNKLSNETKFVQIEVILLKVQLLQSVYILLFSLYFTQYFVHYLRMNLADKMSLLLYWVTYQLRVAGLKYRFTRLIRNSALIGYRIN